MPFNTMVTRNRSDNTLRFYYSAPGDREFHSVSIPSGVTVFPRRTDRVYAKRRHYFVGAPSRGLMFLELDRTLHLLGITAPAAPITLADGGAGALTGEMIGHVTAIHKVGSTLIHESNGSPASNTLSITNREIDWSGIPAVAGESRQTHWGLYRSVDGDTPQLVTELAVGTTTYHDTTAAGARGREMPTNNGVPPYARYIEKYHGRAWYAGVNDHPERVYFSELNNFEAVGDESYINTMQLQPVSSIRARDDQLCIFARSAFYDLQGFNEEDFQMREIDPKVGCISHFANKLKDKRLWFPAADQVYCYNGGVLVPIMRDIWPFWQDDYAAFTSRYNDALAVFDETEKCYKLLVTKPSSPRSFYYVGSYGETGDPTVTQPDWSFDRRAREDSAIGEMELGDGRTENYAGSCDGYVRKENDYTDAGDDGDAFGKEMLISPGVYPLGKRAGGTLRGATVKEITLLMQSELQSFQFTGYGGGPSARQTVTGRWGPHTIAAGNAGVVSAVPREEFFLRPSGLSGKDLTFDIRIAQPLGVAFYGVHVRAEPGPHTRGRTT